VLITFVRMESWEGCEVNCGTGEYSMNEVSRKIGKGLWNLEDLHIRNIS
jgi:hypothetical protein